MKLTWIGGSTFLLELGAFSILADPVFSDSIEWSTGRANREAPLPDVDVGKVAVVCISATRADHFDRAAAGRVGDGVPVVVPAGARDEVAAAGWSDVRELSCWEEWKMESAGESLSIVATPANGNGYFFRHVAGERETTVYWTGDALWSNDIRELQQRYGYANVLVQHIGAEGAGTPGGLVSPDAREAMQFVYRMQPNAVVAIHHHTFSHYTQSLEPFQELIGRTIYEKRLRVLAEGEAFEK